MPFYEYRCDECDTCIGSEVLRHKAGETEEILSPSEIKRERKDQMAKEEKIIGKVVVAQATPN
jgi:hypothetical protein